jgi:hypothetical protein
LGNGFVRIAVLWAVFTVLVWAAVIGKMSLVA